MIRINSIKNYSGTLAQMPTTLPYGDTYQTTDTKELFKYDQDGLPHTVGSNSNSLGSTIVQLSSENNLTSWTGDDSSVYSLILSEDTTLENPTEPVSGQSYQLIVEQDSIGSHSLSFGDIFKFEGGTVPSIEISANSISVITFIYNGSSLLSVAVKNFL